MKILGIDSSGMVASVALIEDGITKAEYTVNNMKTHSQTLLPMLNEIASMLGEDMSDVDAIAVAAGPGSFTGLRIGSACVKGLAGAWNKPIIPVPTVEGLAFNMWGSDRIICPLMDARRDQVYTGLYEFYENGDSCVMETIQDQCAVPIEEIIDKINSIDRSVVFLGDGVPVFKVVIEKTCRVDFVYAPAFANRQRGSVIAALGEIYLKKGISQTANEHAPVYLRLSQAERERNEKDKS
ncbi:MAG: tRNA (adenosine(37)-N6)-threonylcarbamoyltransferase complex dimerization subunit type 1 TsaB [Lachnospiraceae bacterium]|nr:tRNA (adenosine(37)-N6)-threonylcarbamoyltransferase complex dimerization subunit type 1 TsaB [Lachnospiraceae bacterium]